MIMNIYIYDWKDGWMDGERERARVRNALTQNKSDP